MSRLHDCISSFVNVVCGFVNRRSVINKASGSDDSLKSDIYSAGVYGVSELSNPRKQTSALNNDSDISVVSSASTSVSRTARPARTLLRTLFAMLVAAATLLATFVVPAQQANAYDIYWRYNGYGYIAATTTKNGKRVDNATNYAWWVQDAVKVKRTLSDDGKTVTWKVFFNPKGYDRLEPGSPYSGKINGDSGKEIPFGRDPILYAFLPSGLKNISISSQAYKFKMGRRAKKELQVVTRQLPSYCLFSGNQCDNDWNKSLGPGSDDSRSYSGVGASQDTLRWYKEYGNNDKWTRYSINELYKWKDEGKFGNGFISKISEGIKRNEICPEFVWTITAQFDENHSKDDLYKMPFAAGFTSGQDVSGKRNYRKNKFVITGPFDNNGDGIPDTLARELQLYPGVDNSNQIKYPVYERGMLKDFKSAANTPTQYGWTNNVPITASDEIIHVKPYHKLINWNMFEDYDYDYGKLDEKDDNLHGWNNNWSGSMNSAHQDTFTQDSDLTSTKLPSYIGMRYDFNGKLPEGIREDTGDKNSKCNVNRDEGCVKIDHLTGEVTYHPRFKTDWKIKTPNNDNGLLTFPIKVKYPAPGSYNLNYNQRQMEYTNPLTIRVLSQASMYSPNYDETKVDFHETRNNGKDSAKPYNKAKECSPNKDLVNNVINKYGANHFPDKTEFIFPDSSNGYGKARYTFGDSKKPVGDPRLLWASLTGNDPLKNADGIVHFAPSKVTDSGKSFVDFDKKDSSKNGNHTKTPVVVKYADGSSSEDLDAGNICSNGGNVDKEKSVVYAPVHVKKYPPNVKLSIKTGSGMHDYGDPNNKSDRIEIGYDARQYEEITSITGDKKIIFDSWAEDGDGKIDFRVLCHRTDKNSKNPNAYSLLTPPNNKGAGASGSINGVSFTRFRSWDHTNKQEEEKCKKKNNCKPIDTYTYLTSDSYNNDTLQRSRAVIESGKLKEDGKYECKVFAFHQDSESLKKFNDEVKKKNYSNLFDFGSKINGVSDQKDKEWTDGTFTFSVKLKDNQKYNPTYTKIPEFEVGTVPNGAISNISTDQPKSMKKINVNGHQENANGVSDADLESVVDNNTPLPNGTWFTIKRLIKKVDNKKPNDFPVEGEIWSQFEGVQSNKVEGKDEAKDKDPKSTQEYGSVTFRPTKWQDAGEYWAEVVVHYPDGTTSDGDYSINKNHPIYAKVKVTRPKLHDPDINMQLRSQYNSSDGSVSGAWIGTSENLAGINKATGVTVMRGIGLMHDMGIDSWAETEVGPIYQKMLCTEKGKDYWHENLPGLNFQLGTDRKEWMHSSFKQNEDCRKNGNCNPRDYLYNDYVDWAHSHNTMERTRASITNKTAPAKTGEYYCAVFTMKKSLEKAYVSNLGRDGHSANGVNLKLGNAVTGKDVTVRFFPVHVVEPFKLPKTGGEDCVNWNMLMSVVCVLGTGAMAAGFFLDQTKWGRAMLEALLRKALIKAFIRKTAEWCGGVMLRIEWWITERWRC